MKATVAIAVTVLALSASPPRAQEAERVDLQTIMRIRAEGFDNSQVMDTLWHLTDLHGPRLTNSPQERRAAEWARDRMAEFGLENTHLEPWGEFGLGWSVERCVIALVEPTYMPMIAYPKAWTLGTDAEIVGTPVHIQVETEEDLEAYRGQLEGKIVLNGKVTETDSPFEGLAKRHDDERLSELERAPQLDENDSGDSSRWADWRRRRALREMLREMLEEEGVAVVIEPDGGRRNDYGVITLGSGGSRDPEEARALPQVVVSTEHFNRVARLIEREQEVTLSADVRTTFYDDDLLGYNVIGEIPGSDPLLRGQVVMLGGHFDSWHPATGATDNAAPCAVMMEAARILKAIDARPRRTVRVALWTGEEQGLLGSRGYVKEHFGDRDTMQLEPEHAGLSAYFNLDNGAGKIRGVYLQENLAIRPVFEAWLKPFHDLDARTLTIRNTGGTDHLSFDAVGLPGFQFIQDPMDYSTRTHHTNMDFYERVHPADVQQASVIVASFVYHAAMRDDLLPRKPLPEPRVRPEEVSAEASATPVTAEAATSATSAGASGSSEHEH